MTSSEPLVFLSASTVLIKAVWESHLQNSKADTGGYYLRIGVTVFLLYLSTFSLEVAWRLYMNDFLFQPMMMPSGQLLGGQTRKKTLRQWSQDPRMTWWRSGNGECSFLYNTALEIGVFLLSSQVAIREVLTNYLSKKAVAIWWYKKADSFFSHLFSCYSLLRPYSWKKKKMLWLKVGCIWCSVALHFLSWFCISQTSGNA